MPSRTYDSLDIINYSEIDSISDLTAGSGVVSHSIVPIQPFRFSIIWTGAVTDNPPNGGGSNVQGNVLAEGEIDFSLFPTIPVGALISSIRVKVNVSFNVSGTITGADVCQAIASLQSTWQSLPVGQTYSTLTLTGFDLEQQAGVNSAVVNEDITFSIEEEVLFAPALDKTTFETTFALLRLLTTLNAGIGTATNPAPDGHGSHDGTITVDNFQIIVTYGDGTGFTLNPPGGDVEPGSYINAAGPNIAPATFAATADPKVIPIIPKVNGPDDVDLPVPIPPTDDCVGCLTDCPECDDCFDACTNDLTSEACQDCLDACLDCLVECLENLELGEACQQSTQTPAEIPVVIICGFPTRFAGSVPLGNFTILVARASGIYRFIPGKTNDTLYATARDGTTYDVAIPIPFAKTGFFRS